jgi:hypothetical protein
MMISKVKQVELSLGCIISALLHDEGYTLLPGKLFTLPVI